MFSPHRLSKKLSKKIQFLFGVLKANTIGLFSKRDFVIIAFFTLLGAGGVFAAGLITVSAPDAQGAGYTAATACDENVTIKALTTPHTSSGQLYVATIALSDISQNATTGCGGKIMQIALKINGQMSYASWSIPAASSDSTFYLTGATSSINTYYADTLLSPFQADGLTNVAISQIGSFASTSNWTWTERQPSAGTTRNWQSIASSSDGTKIAAISADSSNNVYTSTNSGVSWTSRSSPSLDRYVRSISSSADGAKLAVVNDGAYIYLSTNSGASFSNAGNIVSAAGKKAWRSIAMSTDGTKLAAVVNSGYIYTSSDSGATWTPRTGAPITTWSGVASSSDGTKLAAVANGYYVFTSANSGSTWTMQMTSGVRSWSGITSSSDGTKLAAIDQGGYIYTSADSGSTWTTNSNSSGARNWTGITSSSDGTKIAAIDYGGYIYTSTDSGVTWTETQPTPSTPRNWISITSSSDGTKLAAAAYGGYIYTGTR